MDALPEHTTPDQFADIPPPNQFLSSSSEIPLVSTAADAPFSQSPWNVTDTQTSIPGGTGTTPGGIGSFDEAQWAQIFSSGNWESWGT